MTLCLAQATGFYLNQCWPRLPTSDAILTPVIEKHYLCFHCRHCHPIFFSIRRLLPPTVNTQKGETNPICNDVYIALVIDYNLKLLPSFGVSYAHGNLGMIISNFFIIMLLNYVAHHLP